jgi:ribosomal protein L7/L12
MSEIDYGARARLDYIETQLQALFPDSYVPFAEASTSGMPDAVVALARAGNMIAAIKEYRSVTGAGLAEAKKAVEAMR